MTIFSADAERERFCSCPSTASEQPAASEPDLPELLKGLRQRIDGIRTTGDAGSSHSTGPADLALTVVAEALAIGEAMSRIGLDQPSDTAPDRRSPAVYAEIDSRYVEHRARALRSALHAVDDYVWWGGLAAAAG